MPIIKPLFPTAFKARPGASYVYVLLLNGGKYHIGRTEDLAAKMRYYQDGHGDDWVKAHGVQELVEYCESVSHKDTNKLVIDFMTKYGPENVRGGSFSGLVLLKYPRAVRHLLGVKLPINQQSQLDELIKERALLDEKIAQLGKGNNDAK